MELRGQARGVTVYDDFAHHPTAIRATLEGLRQRVGGARIIAVLEPRSNTMKLGVMKDALSSSLAQADAAYVYDAQLGWDAAEALRPLGSRAHCIADLEALIATLANDARPGDHLVIMSNGGFGGLHRRLLERLSRDP
jgi:UDP-N-acetylmuramate: L-alanyl-gamma-D-glutamyl-meso-diaminopimelate ligase